MEQDIKKEFEFYIWDNSVSPGAEKLSLEYLTKYWLDDEELKNIWLPIQHKVFNPNFIWLPNENEHEFKYQLFNEGFILRPMLGGGLFAQPDLETLNECMKIMGDNYFAVIEDIDYGKEPRYSDNGYKIPQLKFKYPVGIKWDEYMLGDEVNKGIAEGITYELNNMVRNYFVFGDSGKWGKYTANDANEGMGVEIFGFKPEYLDLFRKYFPVSEEERTELEAPLPEHYRNRIIW